MQIRDIIRELEKKAPLSLQESYDNAGLLTGNADWECTGVLCTLDATEAVILEARERGCNLVVAHHPIIFGGLKKLNGKNYVERTVITSIKNDIAMYAIHTNLDNVLDGVNDRIADRLGLTNRRILSPKAGQLMKLYTFVPHAQANQVREALFAAGAGHIGEYSETSFNSEGTGTFKGSENTNPFAGQPGKRHEEKEVKIEVILPAYLQPSVVKALWEAHPYEEVAYDLVSLSNDNQLVGSGLLGELPEALDETGFLHMLKTSFELKMVKHTPLLGKKIKKVAVCGGSGSFLSGKALAAGADVYVTSDIKYHEFFDANDRILLADIGHWESEQFTTDLLVEILQAKFPTFAVLKSGVKTNPVHYFLG
ncbi:MAG: Nif3-like dinuclear metal center hexameric protein [Chitinophagaceae bacterium]|nr:Nif3-like dinuclear metal center hexameric protein [Chitinophagaceae bacterium]MCA6455197.1 Nif3-like dinuclear metal center hexameric protein [Chitinophagaceae bacterium]MCA6459583.1 Nif3-like dinuclear metal center hexameric protein [Chitinophagaceae bacterium]MCA6464450.1 Nif3-like dinuclear metal center hexameric protein [Chitinophagaceae bacterium]